MQTVQTGNGTMKRVLITGGSGFLGAWILRRLHAQGTAARVFDVNADRSKVAEIAGADAAARVEWREGDIRRTDDVVRAAEGCDGVIHLAGVLTPACIADPVRGAEINLIGTINVFEAARVHRLASIVYASSAGVFGPEDPAHPFPTTLYGAYKLAGEGVARSYHAVHAMASIGFRPLVVYGPGRDAGLSAGPSIACREAAMGRAYVHPFSGRSGFVYVEDCADLFVRALASRPTDAAVYNVIGEHASADDVIAQLRRIAPGVKLEVSGPPLPIAPGIAETGLDAAFPGRRRTSLADGLRATFDYYRNRATAR